MSNRALSLTLAFLIPILFMLAMPYASGDLSAWIALGDYFLKTGTVMRHDVFSVLPTSEMVYPAFGSGVFYALLYRVIGLTGVCIVHAVVILPLLLFILYRPLIQNKILPNAETAKWMLFLFWLGGVPTFGERPAMLALIPLVLSFQIIAKIPGKGIEKKDALKLLALQILWANLHGSFILLPLMLMWRFFWDFHVEWKRIALVLGAFLASAINPFGFKIYPYLIETARVSKTRGITEWDFPGLLTQFPTGFLFWALFIGTMFFLFRKSRETTLFQTLRNPFFLFLALGTLSIRNAALCFVVLLPGAFAAGLFRETTLDLPKKRLQNLVVAALALLAIPSVIAFKAKKWDNDVVFGLVDSIRKDGRTCSIFNDWELGGFLMLELPNQTYLDTRNIIFSSEAFRQYEETLAGEPIWEDFLRNGKTCFVIVDETTSAGLIERLNANPNWKRIGSENTHVLYTLIAARVN